MTTPKCEFCEKGIPFNESQRHVPQVWGGEKTPAPIECSDPNHCDACGSFEGPDGGTPRYCKACRFLWKGESRDAGDGKDRREHNHIEAKCPPTCPHYNDPGCLACWDRGRMPDGSDCRICLARGRAPLRVHHVTVEVRAPLSHAQVQARVIKAVVDAFPDRDGHVTVTGFDLAKKEKELAELREERDLYRGFYTTVHSLTQGYPAPTPGEVTPSWLTKDVEDLPGLSPRVVGKLKREGIETVEALCARSRGWLSKKWGFGAGSLLEIERALLKQGLKLSEDEVKA